MMRAGDNLAWSCAAVEFLRDMAAERAAGRGLAHLRITAAKRTSNHPVWNLNLDCLSDRADFFPLTSDINGSVGLSAELAARRSAVYHTPADTVDSVSEQAVDEAIGLATLPAAMCIIGALWR